MPFEPLMERLTEKTGGRLVVSDTATEAPTTEPSLADLSEAQRTSFIRRLTVDDLFYRETRSISRPVADTAAEATEASA